MSRTPAEIAESNDLRVRIERQLHSSTQSYHDILKQMSECEKKVSDLRARLSSADLTQLREINAELSKTLMTYSEVMHGFHKIR